MVVLASHLHNFAGTAVANAAVFTGHPTLESDAYQAHAVLSIGKTWVGREFNKTRGKLATLIF